LTNKVRATNMRKNNHKRVSDSNKK